MVNTNIPLHEKKRIVRLGLFIGEVGYQNLMYSEFYNS